MYLSISSKSFFGVTRAYTCVVLISECPNILLTVSIGTPHGNLPMPTPKTLGRALFYRTSSQYRPQAQVHRPSPQMGYSAYIVCWQTSPNGYQRRIGFSSYIKITNTTPRYCQGISHCHLRIYRKIVSGRQYVWVQSFLVERTQLCVAMIVYRRDRSNEYL